LLSIIQATTEKQIQHVRELLAEYFEYLRTDVDTALADLNDAPPLAGYREELAGLPGKYASPDGRLLLAQYDGAIAGCVAFQRITEDICEVKRLWTRPEFRGKKIGRALVERLIEEAREVGYTSMILSTVDILKEAQSLYRSLGFELTAPYFDGPEELMAHEIFMKLILLTE
jgi:GNAT superfamily N-acetyltransferase